MTPRFRIFAVLVAKTLVIIELFSLFTVGVLLWGESQLQALASTERKDSRVLPSGSGEESGGLLIVHSRIPSTVHLSRKQDVLVSRSEKGKGAAPAAGAPLPSGQFQAGDERRQTARESTKTSRKIGPRKEQAQDSLVPTKSTRGVKEKALKQKRERRGARSASRLSPSADAEQTKGKKIRRGGSSRNRARARKKETVRDRRGSSRRERSDDVHQVVRDSAKENDTGGKDKRSSRRRSLLGDTPAWNKMFGWLMKHRSRTNWRILAVYAKGRPMPKSVSWLRERFRRSHLRLSIISTPVSNLDDLELISKQKAFDGVLVHDSLLPKLDAILSIVRRHKMVSFGYGSSLVKAGVSVGLWLNVAADKKDRIFINRRSLQQECCQVPPIIAKLALLVI